jgi:hypothetical protein
MNLARTKVLVPEVYDHGYFGNCAYILMEREMDTIDTERYINLAVPRRIGRRVQDIVANLASLGLDRLWSVKSIEEWMAPQR